MAGEIWDVDSTAAKQSLSDAQSFVKTIDNDLQK
jgi:hypothetical protein